MWHQCVCKHHTQVSLGLIIQFATVCIQKHQEHHIVTTEQYIHMYAKPYMYCQPFAVPVLPAHTWSFDLSLSPSKPFSQSTHDNHYQRLMHSFHHWPIYVHSSIMEYVSIHHKFYNIPHTVGFPDHNPFLWQNLKLVLFNSYPMFSSQTKQALEPGVVPL